MRRLPAGYPAGLPGGWSVAWAEAASSEKNAVSSRL